MSAICVVCACDCMNGFMCGENNHYCGAYDDITKGVCKGCDMPCHYGCAQDVKIPRSADMMYRLFSIFKNNGVSFAKIYEYFKHKPNHEDIMFANIGVATSNIQDDYVVKETQLLMSTVENNAGKSRKSTKAYFIELFKFFIKLETSVMSKDEFVTEFKVVFDKKKNNEMVWITITYMMCILGRRKSYFMMNHDLKMFEDNNIDTIFSELYEIEDHDKDKFTNFLNDFPHEFCLSKWVFTDSYWGPSKAAMFSEIYETHKVCIYDFKFIVC